MGHTVPGPPPDRRGRPTRRFGACGLAR